MDARPEDRILTQSQNKSTPYDEAFYAAQVEGSLRSARILLEILWRHIQPRRVLDVGCGRGAWLSACGERGAKILHGIDGYWNRGDAMIDDKIAYQSSDLEKSLRIDEHYDLAICLEVAEHLDPSRGQQFIKSLTTASNVILFSAAYSNQGGTSHINEQPHTYWGKTFLELNYLPFDLFRQEIWGNDQVEFWYRQNAFLFVNGNSDVCRRIQNEGILPMANIAFMDCIHPKLFEQILWGLRRADSRARHATEFKHHLRDLIPSFWRSVRIRFG